MKRTVEYKGYQASVEFADDALFLKVLHIDDLLIVELDSASKAQKALEDLIEGYLADCAEEGRQPDPQFKGTLNVRLGPDLHKRAAMRAASEGLSFNRWICVAVEEKLECGKLSERIDGVFGKSRARIEAAALSKWVGDHLNEFSYGVKTNMSHRHWNSPSMNEVPGPVVAAMVKAKMHA
jgi:predicted HicB family RNase H-like nuclease